MRENKKVPDAPQQGGDIVDVLMTYLYQPRQEALRWFRRPGEQSAEQERCRPGFSELNFLERSVSAHEDLLLTTSVFRCRAAELRG